MAWLYFVGLDAIDETLLEIYQIHLLLLYIYIELKHGLLINVHSNNNIILLTVLCLKFFSYFISLTILFVFAESHRHSDLNRLNSPRQVSSPVNSHSPSPYGFRVTSPLSSPLRSPVEKSSSPAFRTNTSSFEKSASSAFHINGSSVENTSPGFRINHSPSINGLRSPLHSPGFRSSPSPLGSPGARSSPSFQYNTTVDTSSNVKGKQT